ncbi:putative serine/threonine-protein kinase nek3 [Diplonema papillatum]|nr:putative serine/threonine-protein kinase nek3 [Diplonema papillatum]KAJ9465233.1 putative serine/threonine-protein kinase nek3 [Diplonema papillatum]
MRGRPKGFGLFTTGNEPAPTINLMPTIDDDETLNIWRGSAALEKAMRDRHLEFLTKGCNRIEVGRGAFAKAYLAKNNDGRELVVKEVDLTLLKDDQRKKAELEVTFLKSLNHMNVIRCLDSFCTTHVLHIVLEYASRGTLAQQIEDKKTTQCSFAREEVLKWFAELCAALRHLHSSRVLHRDLKTANVFLDSELRVKLGDFGLSRKIEDDENYSGQMVGTPYYFAPEVVEKKPFNNKTDVWSAGVIAYELAFLQKPFQGKSLRGVYKRIQSGVYEPIPDTADPDVLRLLTSILVIEPRDRPSAAKLCRDTALSQYVGEDTPMIEVPPGLKKRAKSEPGEPTPNRRESRRDKSEAVSKMVLSISSMASGSSPSSPNGRAEQPCTLPVVSPTKQDAAVVRTPAKFAKKENAEDEYGDDFEPAEECGSDDDYFDYEDDFESFESSDDNS